MNTLKMPDITLAQILAALAWVVGQIVAMGFVDNDTGQLVLQVGTTVLSAVWFVADAIIRHGRSKVAVAAVVQGHPPVKSTRV